MKIKLRNQVEKENIETAKLPNMTIILFKGDLIRTGNDFGINFRIYMPIITGRAEISTLY